MGRLPYVYGVGSLWERGGMRGAHAGRTVDMLNCAMARAAGRAIRECARSAVFDVRLSTRINE